MNFVPLFAFFGGAPFNWLIQAFCILYEFKHAELLLISIALGNFSPFSVYQILILEGMPKPVGRTFFIDFIAIFLI